MTLPFILKTNLKLPIGGSFLEGFAYPFFLYGMISLATLPIFYIQQKQKDTPPEEIPPAKHPYLLTILKGFGLVTYMFGYIIGPASIIEDYFFPLDDSISYSATFDLYILYWIIGLFVMCMLVFLYSKRGIFPSFAWYDCATEDGLIIKRFAYTKTYTWDDLDYYTMSAYFDGTLIYSVVMKDGTKADCIGGSAIGLQNLPEEKYPDYDYDFVRYLTRKFTDMGVELRVENWNKLYRKLKYDSWIELAEDIREIAEK